MNGCPDPILLCPACGDVSASDPCATCGVPLTPATDRQARSARAKAAAARRRETKEQA